jgi:hypothetical protein
MDKIINVIYNSTLCITLLTSLWAWCRGNKEIPILAVYLFIAVFTEAMVLIFKFNYLQEDETSLRRIFYFLYIPIEYLCLAAYFYQVNHSKPIRQAIFISVPVYFIISAIIFSLLLSGIEYPLSKENTFPFPGQYNIEGVLLIIFSVITMFSVKVSPQRKLSGYLYYWICLGLLIYHTAIFISVALTKSNPVDANTFIKWLSEGINNTANILMYILFMIGFIRSTKGVAK